MTTSSFVLALLVVTGFLTHSAYSNTPTANSSTATPVNANVIYQSEAELLKAKIYKTSNIKVSVKDCALMGMSRDVSRHKDLSCLFSKGEFATIAIDTPTNHFAKNYINRPRFSFSVECRSLEWFNNELTKSKYYLCITDK